MSSYVNFYIKNLKTNTYTPLLSCCRSSVIYQIVNNSNIRGIRVTRDEEDHIEAEPVSYNYLEKFINSGHEKLNDIANQLKENEEAKDFLLKSNNPIDEKMSAFFDLNESHHELVQSQDEIIYSLHFFQLLHNIAEEAIYSYGDGTYENNMRDYVIYAGIEASAPSE